MKVLVIYTHPNHQSLNYAFLQRVIQGCSENPHITDIQVLDLYEERFDPVLVGILEPLRSRFSRLQFGLHFFRQD